MKIDARPLGLVPEDCVDPEVDPQLDERTRDRVRRMVVERGPVTAAELACELGLTPAAVRRHLDLLLTRSQVTVWEAPTGGQRGRGRPARRFVVADGGHDALPSSYAELAASALEFLGQVAGPDAVRRFADERIAEFERRLAPGLAEAGDDPARRAEILAEGLSRDGYAASTRPLQVGTTSLGVQLCQGHCPVQHVARQFPELCEAETDAFSRILGVHVQRLATLAHGEHVCTTHIPPTRERQPE